MPFDDAMPIIELAYAMLAFVAWAWALSQVRIAIQRPTPWRWTTVAWMIAKSGFFTVIGSFWWFNYLNLTLLNVAIVILALVHTFAFIHWLRLDAAPPMPFPPPPATDEELRNGNLEHREEVVEQIREAQDQSALMQAETTLVNTQRGKILSKAGALLSAQRLVQDNRRGAMDDEQRKKDAQA